MKRSLPVTLLAADTTPKAHLAARAIERTLEQADFQQLKLLTADTSLKHAVQIPELHGLEGYSEFCIRKMADYVDTSWVLVVQADGYVLNGAAWSDEFLNYDYIGAPFNVTGAVGNGGFSLRSRKLLTVLRDTDFGDSPHPEDNYICLRHRHALEQKGIRFAPHDVASRFAFEGRSWRGSEWQSVPTAWSHSFGFHSLLTVLPENKKPCRVFHHSLDQGDLIYGLAVVKALGGGMLFVSPDNRYPYPLNSRWARTGADPAVVDNLKPLIVAQDYIWGCSFTHGLPFSTDYDLNKFRLPWRDRTARDYDSILRLHCDAFGLALPTEPWLQISDPITVPGKPFVVNRTQRYQNDDFPWDRLVRKYGSQMVFIGSETEANLFKGLGAPHVKVDWYPTKNALEMARVIAGARVFIGNQSLALSIAHGLHKTVIVEEWPQNANCKIDRPGAFYHVPDQWL